LSDLPALAVAFAYLFVHAVFLKLEIGEEAGRINHKPIR
jgi:hypothetical protein